MHYLYIQSTKCRNMPNTVSTVNRAWTWAPAMHKWYLFQTEVHHTKGTAYKMHFKSKHIETSKKIKNHQSSPTVAYNAFLHVPVRGIAFLKCIVLHRIPWHRSSLRFGGRGTCVTSCRPPPVDKDSGRRSVQSMWFRWLIPIHSLLKYSCI